jgi:hypothetical protein
MKKLLLLLFVSFSLLNAQSVGARFGVYQPHADFRGKTSPGNIAGIFGTLNSPASVSPIEFGASLWQGAHRAEIWEGYWSINYRLYQDQGLSGFVFVRPTMRRIVLKRTLSMESSSNAAVQLGVRLYHFGVLLDAGYKFGRLEHLNAGGLEVSLGYLVEI